MSIDFLTASLPSPNSQWENPMHLGWGGYSGRLRIAQWLFFPCLLYISNQTHINSYFYAKNRFGKKVISCFVCGQFVGVQNIVKETFILMVKKEKKANRKPGCRNNCRISQDRTGFTFQVTRV